MNVEENRLRTYSNWPANAAIDATRVAKAGFYYTGRALEVQCFLCETKISDWNYGDQAMARHRQAYPGCPFVQNPSGTSNVPIVPLSASTPELSTSSSSRLWQRNNSGEEGSSLTPPTDPNPDPEREYITMAQRLLSFTNWPISSVVSPVRLAKSGFYYLQQGDMVKCFFCRGVVMKWEPGDDPDREHRVLFPRCTFYLQNSNEPDMVEIGVVKLLPGTSADLKDLGIQAHTAPHKPKYTTCEERLRTFQDWPQNMKQTPEMLAMAGFYYLGTGDEVRCYHCDGGLHTWDATDDVWVEHARWFPKCGFINLVRGQEFIRHCVDNRPLLDLSTITGTLEEANREAAETPPVSLPTVTSSTEEVTDTVLEELLSTPPTVSALETGVSYANTDQVIEDILREDIIRDDTRSESPNPINDELIYSLSQYILSLSMSNISEQLSESQPNQVCSEPEDNDAVETKGDSQESDSVVNENDTFLQTTETMSDETISLEEENRRLKEARLCKICMDRELAIVFLPCGHLATCVHCAPSLTCCPMCRQEIRGTVRTFLS